MMFTIKIILMVAAAIAVFYGLLYEDKVVAFEDKVCRAIKNKIKSK